MALEENQLTSTIPDWIGQLTNLKFVALGGNKLNGEIPSSLTSLSILSELSLEDNMLSGSIDILNDIPTLTRVYVGGNNFKGKVQHSFLLDLKNLIELDISSNRFTGTIPHHFLTYEVLDIHSNDIAGEIPSVERDDYPIEYLFAHNNALSGTLHNSIANLKYLTHFDVSNNELSSTIPESLADMESLQSLYLANNPWQEGPIPFFGNLTDLTELSLKGTNREGPIPGWLGRELRDLTMLSLDNNNLRYVCRASLFFGSTLTRLSRFLSHTKLLPCFDSGEIPQTLGHLKHMEYLLLNQVRTCLLILA